MIIVESEDPSGEFKGIAASHGEPGAEDDAEVCVPVVLNGGGQAKLDVGGVSIRKNGLPLKAGFAVPDAEDIHCKSPIFGESQFGS